MPNYYQIINVSSNATETEIEQALDVYYHKIRRLVTHHDPEVVNRANRDLLALEKIRSTLMDAGKRSAYDAAVNSLVGGLGDPQVDSPLSAARANSSVGAPQASHASSSSSPPSQVINQRSWLCPSCQLPNTMNSQFCKKCGTTLAVHCPACGQLVERIAEFCTSCGVNVRKAEQKKELEKELGQFRFDLQGLTKNIPVLDSNLPQLNRLVLLSGAWAVVSLFAGFMFVFAVLGEFPGLDLTGLIAPLMNEVNSGTSSAGDLLLAGVGLFVLVCVVIFLSVIRKTSPLRGLGPLTAAFFFICAPKTLWALQMLAGVEETLGAVPVLIMAAFLYAIVSLSISNLVKRDIDTLKLYHPRMPKLGCLGTLFVLILSATPLFYCLTLIVLVGGFIGELDTFVNEVSGILSSYQSTISLTNGLQFFFLGILLLVFALIGVRTCQAIETRFRQAVMERSERMEKLIRQIDSLEQAINQINLRSR